MKDGFMHNGKRYYYRKSDAEKQRKKGEIIYYEPYMDAYYIVKIKSDGER